MAPKLRKSQKSLKRPKRFLGQKYNLLKISKLINLLVSVIKHRNDILYAILSQFEVFYVEKSRDITLLRFNVEENIRCYYYWKTSPRQSQ